MNIWDSHGIFFLIGLALIPGITLLFFAATPFGMLAWLGWFFCPHLLVAILAIPYFGENPVLVIIAWIMAFAGTQSESSAARRHRKTLKGKQ